jgi:hypothetical protein
LRWNWELLTESVRWRSSIECDLSDVNAHSNHLKKFPGRYIFVGNLIVNDQNFYSIHHLISLHSRSLAVFDVVWNQSNYWWVPCLSSSTPPWGLEWVQPVTLNLKSSIVNDTFWTSTLWSTNFFKCLADRLDQRSIFRAVLCDPLIHSACHNVDEDFWSLAIILVVNFAIKGLMIVQRALTKSSDDRRMRGHKKS